MYQHARYLPAGDKSIVIEFGNEISEVINRKIRGMTLMFERDPINGVAELVPTYRSLTVYYDPLQIGFEELVQKLTEVEQDLASVTLPQPRVIQIPVLYGGECGPDLSFVAEHNRLSADEVIAIHTSTDYLIYMLGFTPGFPYLGGMSEKIATPRLTTPRTKIPRGSVGIAGSQTGIYPIDSPGGWQLIGRTPLSLYDPERESPVLLKAGDYIRFFSVDEAEYADIARRVSAGDYQIIIRDREQGV